MTPCVSYKFHRAVTKTACWGGLGMVFVGLAKKFEHYPKILCEGIKEF